MTIWAEFLQHTGRPVQKWTQYFPAYERHFGRFQNLPVTMLEIGVAKGGSLQMWRKYLGPHATVVGVDIEERCREYEEDQIHVRIGDQADTAFLQSLVDEFGTFDIILDDGSHAMVPTIASFRHLYPRMNPTGVYMVEDVHTSYVPRYGGGTKLDGTFIELCKTLIDQLHAQYSKTDDADGFSKGTISMHFYDSIVAFEKGPHGRARSMTMGQ